jgi:hypothetical protein
MAGGDSNHRTPELHAGPPNGSRRRELTVVPQQLPLADLPLFSMHTRLEEWTGRVLRHPRQRRIDVKSSASVQDARDLGLRDRCFIGCRCTRHSTPFGHLPSSGSRIAVPLRRHVQDLGRWNESWILIRGAFASVLQILLRGPGPFAGYPPDEIPRTILFLRSALFVWSLSARQRSAKIAGTAQWLRVTPP